MDDARVDWHVPAATVDRVVRACTPAPGAWTTYEGERLKLGPVRVDPDHPPVAVGRLEVTKRTVHVGTATHAVELGLVQPTGKQPMPAADWARGIRVGPGAGLA